MEKNRDIKISVRNLVEFVMRAGDLDMRFMGSSRAVEGTIAHQKIQKENREKYSVFLGEEYSSEVSLKHIVPYNGGNIIIDGRADGILIKDNEVTIDEIKTVTKDLELLHEDYNSLHWAQAKCYAYIYGIQNNRKDMYVQLTYYEIDSEKIKRFIKAFSIKELQEFFNEIISSYFIWANITSDWNKARDSSIKDLKFPFDNYREGQRELAVSVYKTVVEHKKMFLQAPTGVGKTISTLFPAVKAMGEGYTSKIFYLTAKTITRQVAQDALHKMKDNGLKFKTITITAKDKICFSKGSACNPEQCKFAKGHFDRVNEALQDILENENTFSREVIEIYSNKYNICPFEFSLDLTIWSDCVICDYNYVFDPRVYLKRFFMDNNGDYTILVDEAHNLVDRAREMFSCEFHKKPLLELKKEIKGRQDNLYKVLNKLNALMLSMKKMCNEDGYYKQNSQPEDIYNLLNKLTKILEIWLTKNEKSEVYDKFLDLYFNSLSFIRISELYDDKYITYVECTEDDVVLKMFCLDPSKLLREASKRGKSVVFFSATLLPLLYFKEILGGKKEDYHLTLDSPFNKKNIKVMIAKDISTKYKYRENSYSKIVEYIHAVINAKNGNYMVFFPSYKYMEVVSDIFVLKYPQIKVRIQTNFMTEDAREAFLQNFSNVDSENILGFGVLGGIFSEGIDLKGDRLIGAIVIGVGLPMICFEKEIIVEYYDKKSKCGYEYSYMYPGMNKVLQAAGRVIRTEEDRGTVLLIDDRFLEQRYRRLFPKQWDDFIRINSSEDARKKVCEFWE
ncbi:ATP-dependent DNA helicase [Clostridium tagluense]|uniref:ATP-dependent DNA helicase n=1 Tax=Clostridium tagluense TaxID=360422 RepID=UPI001CF4D8EB|nr:ATP-dependent DNA helicase [Clostridium tagluense]MCB2312526.1 ATP-dependent DNA helicase [Clostridium tagluense]MCB2317207.1 ATP-dependent DNA helicase [Clostridium tagluense]MCB2322071.1 ATP-dependent DNA helicase [Clostridium tagluense]MCB2327156.1 ATP-dependent DNA helicase [Clostridium tagluense]MCB2331868.1 ATP-dependent DNA helicase [Clostridium tagluense]